MHENRAPVLKDLFIYKIFERHYPRDQVVLGDSQMADTFALHELICLGRSITCQSQDGIGHNNRNFCRLTWKFLGNSLADQIVFRNDSYIAAIFFISREPTLKEFKLSITLSRVCSESMECGGEHINSPIV